MGNVQLDIRAIGDLFSRYRPKPPDTPKLPARLLSPRQKEEKKNKQAHLNQCREEVDRLKTSPTSKNIKAMLTRVDLTPRSREILPEPPRRPKRATLTPRQETLAIPFPNKKVQKPAQSKTKSKQYQELSEQQKEHYRRLSSPRNPKTVLSSPNEYYQNYRRETLEAEKRLKEAQLNAEINAETQRANESKNRQETQRTFDNLWKEQPTKSEDASPKKQTLIPQPPANPLLLKRKPSEYKLAHQKEDQETLDLMAMTRRTGKRRATIIQHNQDKQAKLAITEDKYQKLQARLSADNLEKIVDSYINGTYFPEETDIVLDHKMFKYTHPTGMTHPIIKYGKDASFCAENPSPQVSIYKKTNGKIVPLTNEERSSLKIIVETSKDARELLNRLKQFLQAGITIALRPPVEITFREFVYEMLTYQANEEVQNLEMEIKEIEASAPLDVNPTKTQPLSPSPTYSVPPKARHPNTQPHPPR